MSEDKKVGYVAQFSATLSQDGISITFNFNMPEDASKVDFSEKIDMLRDVVARQRAKSEVPMLEAMIAEKEAVLRNQELDLNQYLKRETASVNDETSERIKARIDEMTDDIARGKRQLEATRLKSI